MYDLIIIGAGPAGLYAATCAAMNKIKAAIIESSSEYGGQLTLYREKTIYDMPGFARINANDLANNLYLQYKEYEDEVPLYMNTQATGVEEHEHFYILHTNQGIFRTKTILLANGGGMFQPKKLEIPKAEKMINVHYFIKDTSILKDKDVVVLGGGDSAVDWALTLVGIAKSVTLVHRRHDFRAHQHNVEHARKKLNVMTPYVAKDVTGDFTASELILEHIETKELVAIKTDAILVFYGVSPVKSKMDQWLVDVKDNSIMVSPNMQTSRNGIYAVGNSVFYEGKLRMIVTALGEAATAIGAITKFFYPEKTLTYKH
ncbi:MAG: NAD(P)/FAD-dependent oxidoreductase [Acholeplasmataceae bacterium]|nr:NAD(P)/FAD-dependent oxidoreductase [Acholeplasmataceae bacterium]